MLCCLFTYDTRRATSCYNGFSYASHVACSGIIRIVFERGEIDRIVVWLIYYSFGKEETSLPLYIIIEDGVRTNSGFNFQDLDYKSRLYTYVNNQAAR